jgi:hypothetical protein
MAKAGRHARKKRNSTIAWALVIAFVIAIFTAWVVYMKLTAQPGLDKVTLCPAGGPQGHFVLLVDKTDPLNFTQKQAFSVALSGIIEKRIPAGYLLSIYVLTEDFKINAEPLLELCNPGTGADKDSMTANLKKLRQQYEHKFVEPMRKQSDALLSTTPAKTSPIFEMVQLVGINAFRKHDIKGERRLIILSDMLHNTPQFSMFRNPADYDYATFAATTYGKKTQVDLGGTDVELLYLLHAPQLQTKRNLLFWEEYFKKSGARVVAVQPLEG